MTKFTRNTLFKQFIFLTSMFAMHAHAQIILQPTPPSLNANAFILMDYYSGRILVGKHANKRIEPASLTKMMTVYLIDRALKQGTIQADQGVPISERAWRTQGSRMFVEVNKRVPVSELLKGIVVQSGNDASVAMAEFIAGSEAAFVTMMNQQAQHLGMQHSHFVNATGLPDKQHYSTAQDMAILARAIIRDFPEFYDLYAQKWFSYNGIKQPNRNRLLWRDSRVDGIKTGHTEKAGYCIVTSAKTDHMRLIAVVLGAKDDSMRTKQTQQLLDYGFRFFDTHKLYGGYHAFADTRIWQGSNKTVPVGVADDVYLTLLKGNYQAVRVNMHLNKVTKAPLKKTDPVGELIIHLDDKILKTVPIISLAELPVGNVWRRVADYTRLKLGYHTQTVVRQHNKH